MNRRVRRIIEEYARDRDLQTFVAALEGMLAEGQDFFMVFAELGAGYLNLNRLDEALAAYRSALERNPDSSGVAYQVGRILARQGQHEEAVVHFARAVALDASNSKPAADLGVSLMILGRLPEAITAFEQALAADPDDVVARNGLPQAIALAEMPLDQRPTIALDTSVPLGLSRDSRRSPN
jgi:tetratricopeptide (TPR) repeat protein